MQQKPCSPSLIDVFANQCMRSLYRYLYYKHRTVSSHQPAQIKSTYNQYTQYTKLIWKTHRRNYTSPKIPYISWNFTTMFSISSFIFGHQHAIFTLTFAKVQRARGWTAYASNHSQVQPRFQGSWNASGNCLGEERGLWLSNLPRRTTSGILV